MVKVQQYEVFWISLDPTLGSEMAKTRPCTVISPNEMNDFLQTLIIIPITSTIKNYPWRVPCVIANKQGSIATDQIKTVDRARLGSKIGKLTKTEIALLKDVLHEMLID